MEGEFPNPIAPTPSSAGMGCRAAPGPPNPLLSPELSSGVEEQALTLSMGLTKILLQGITPPGTCTPRGEDEEEKEEEEELPSPNPAHTQQG